MDKVSSPSPKEQILHSTVRVGGVPSAGQDITIEANRAEREALARLGRLDGVEKLVATLSVRQRGKELRVNGMLEADVLYNCVRTLDSFPAHISEKISVRFAPPQEHGGKHVDLSFGDDAPEPLIDGRANLGSLVEEFFLLSLDPYPHKPGSDYIAKATAEDPGNPVHLHAD